MGGESVVRIKTKAAPSQGTWKSQGSAQEDNRSLFKLPVLILAKIYHSIQGPQSYIIALKMTNF